jgi:hypothetical protein
LDLIKTNIRRSTFEARLVPGVVRFWALEEGLVDSAIPKRLNAEDLKN